MTKIWLYRWIFDNLKLIVKILWEKDPIASLYQRIEMIKI